MTTDQLEGDDATVAYNVCQVTFHVTSGPDPNIRSFTQADPTVPCLRNMQAYGITPK